MPYEVPEYILDNLAQVESRGDPKAIGRPVKRKDGTYERAQGLYQFMPSTTAMLKKQGYSFDPWNPVQARGAAAFYLQKLLERHQGDWDKALADYGGHISNPEGKVAKQYIARVKGNAMNSAFDTFFDSGIDKSVKTKPAKSFDELFDTSLPYESDVPQVITPEVRQEQEEERVARKQSNEVRVREEPLSLGASIVDTGKGLGKAIIGAGEAALTLGTGAGASIAGPVVGIGKRVLQGVPITEAQKTAGEITKDFTYQPRTEYGKSILETIAQTAEKLKIPAYIPIGPHIQQRVAGRGEIKRRVDNLEVSAPRQGGSVGAAGTPIKARVEEAKANASPATLNAIGDKPLKDVDYRAVNRQNLADKFGYTLTEGQSKGDVRLRSDEYNLAPQLDGRLQQRLHDERIAALDKGFTDFRDRHTPDIFDSGAHTGQTLLDEVRTKFQPVLDNEKALWNQTKAIFNNQLRYDNEAFSRNLNAELKRNGLTHFVPDNVKALLREFTEAKVSTFDEYDAMRTVLAKIQRSAADGNAKQAAFIIHKHLNELNFKTANPKAKAMLDAARKATREKYQFLEKNPIVKMAIDDIRSAEEIASGVLQVGADSVISKTILGSNDKASTANVQRLISYLTDGGKDQTNRGAQALRSAVLDYLESKGFNKTGRGDVFRTETFIEALDNKQTAAKLRTILTPQQLNELADIAAFAKITAPVPRTGHANVSNTFRGNLAEVSRGVAETYIQTKPGGWIANIALRDYFMRKRIDRALKPSFTYKNVNLREPE